MKKAKTVFPFFLILLICLVSFRFLFFASYMRLQKVEFRRQLILTQTNEVKILEFFEDDLFVNKNGFEWKHENKELVVNGLFHEVISITKKNGRALVSIILDKAENQLLQNYFALNKSIHHHGANLIKGFLSLNYLHTIPTIALQVPTFQIKRKVFETCFKTTDYCLKTIKPPQFL